MADYSLLVNLLKERTIPNSIAIGVLALKAEFEHSVFTKVAFTAVNDDFKVDLPLNQAISSLFNTANPDIINDVKAHLTAAITSECPELQIKAINTILAGHVTIIFNVA